MGCRGSIRDTACEASALPTVLSLHPYWLCFLGVLCCSPGLRLVLLPPPHPDPLILRFWAKGPGPHTCKMKVFPHSPPLLSFISVGGPSRGCSRPSARVRYWGRVRLSRVLGGPSASPLPVGAIYALSERASGVWGLKPRSRCRRLATGVCGTPNGNSWGLPRAWQSLPPVLPGRAHRCRPRGRGPVSGSVEGALESPISAWRPGPRGPGPSSLLQPEVRSFPGPAPGRLERRKQLCL